MLRKTKTSRRPRTGRGNDRKQRMRNGRKNSSFPTLIFRSLFPINVPKKDVDVYSFFLRNSTAEDAPFLILKRLEPFMTCKSYIPNVEV